MKIKHPLSRADYARNADGTVTVSVEKRGTGTFDRKGRWLEGELRIADALMCMFVSDGLQTNPGAAGRTVLEAAMNSKEADV